MGGQPLKGSGGLYVEQHGNDALRRLKVVSSLEVVVSDDLL